MILDQAASWISAILILSGAFFYVVGGIGLVRMPDLFTRMHGASVLDTVGGSLMLVGMMFAGGFTLVTVKLVIILAVIIFTSPVATHALAQAALHAGIEPQLVPDGVMGEKPRRKPAARSAAAAKRAGRGTTSRSGAGKAKGRAKPSNR